MYKAKEVMSIIKQAKNIAPSSEMRKIAERFEDWLNWDNGNIHSAEQKNEILKLVKEKKYSEALLKFEALKDCLSDQRAIDEIEWRIAGIQFNE